MGAAMRYILTVFAILLCAMTVSGGSAIADTIYTVDLPPTGDLTLTGTITTDGNLGAITRADIVGWDLTVWSASLSSGYEFTPLDSTLKLASSGGDGSAVALNATATTLTFLPQGSEFVLQALIGEGYGMPTGQAVVTPSPPGGNVEYFRTCNAAGVCDEVEIGLPFGVQLADAGQVVTPLPAALPLFATGLGGLGLLGWRRKRKAQAVA